MAMTVKFRFQPGDTVHYAGITGIHKTVVESARFSTKDNKTIYGIAEGLTSMEEEHLFESVQDLRDNIKYLGD